MTDLRHLVARDGERVRAFGEVIAVGEGVWFQPNLPRLLPYYPPGTEPAPRTALSLAVEVTGVDLDRLSRREQHRDGTVFGWAALVGVWRNGRISVDEQGAADGDSPDRMPRWTQPPCDPPEGGWPLIAEHLRGGDVALDWPEDREGPEVVNVTIFRPGPDRAVAVIASSDPEATRRRLGPSLGDRLCVVASRWTRTQVDKVRDELGRGDWPVYSHGETSDEAGQLVVSVEIQQVTEPFAAFAARTPDGLLDVQPWLRPVSPGGEFGSKRWSDG